MGLSYLSLVDLPPIYSSCLEIIPDTTGSSYQFASPRETPFFVLLVSFLPPCSPPTISLPSFPSLILLFRALGGVHDIISLTGMEDIKIPSPSAILDPTPPPVSGGPSRAPPTRKTHPPPDKAGNNAIANKPKQSKSRNGTVLPLLSNPSRRKRGRRSVRHEVESGPPPLHTCAVR